MVSVIPDLSHQQGPRSEAAPPVRSKKGHIPALDADVIGAVLAAITDVDAQVVGHAAAAWVMLSKAHREACTFKACHAWRELTALHFANAPTFVSDDARLNFFALCTYTWRCRTRRWPLPLCGPHAYRVNANRVKAFVFAAVRRDGKLLRRASVELRADKDVVLAAVSQDGGALGDACDELRADKEVVLAAVHKAYFRGSYEMSALQFASEDLRADKEVVLAAVRHCRYALQDASVDLRADTEILRTYQNLYTDSDAGSDAGSDSDSDSG